MQNVTFHCCDAHTIIATLSQLLMQLQDRDFAVSRTDLHKEHYVNVFTTVSILTVYIGHTVLWYAVTTLITLQLSS